MKPWINFEKKIHRVIKLNQKVWLKSYMEINTELRKKQKMTSKKTFSVDEQLAWKM